MRHFSHNGELSPSCCFYAVPRWIGSTQMDTTHWTIAISMCKIFQLKYLILPSVQQLLSKVTRFQFYQKVCDKFKIVIKFLADLYSWYYI